MPAPLASDDIELERLLEASSDLILVTDPYGLFLRVSQSSKTLLNYDADFMVGRLAVDFIYPDDLVNTREEMRQARRTGRSRYFACRYFDAGGQVVDLVWRGMWLPAENVYLFMGRPPLRGETEVWIRKLDVLDGLQVSAGIFALSLVFSWCLGIGNNATAEVRRIIAEFNGDSPSWAAFMTIYAGACLTCLVWKHRWFQFGTSIASTVVWIWTGFVTLWAPTYSASAGLYEVMLGFGSILVLYFRGRRL